MPNFPCILQTTDHPPHSELSSRLAVRFSSVLNAVSKFKPSEWIATYHDTAERERQHPKLQPIEYRKPSEGIQFCYPLFGPSLTPDIILEYFSPRVHSLVGTLVLRKICTRDHTLRISLQKLKCSSKPRTLLKDAGIVKVCLHVWSQQMRRPASDTLLYESIFVIAMQTNYIP